MSNFRKTLPLPPPGRTVDDALEMSLRHPPQRKSAGTERKSIAPRPRLSSSSAGDLRRSPKPGARKSSLPPPPAPASGLAPDLEGSQNWLTHGRALAQALEDALATGSPPPDVQAAIERAYRAWNLDGASPRQISQVAHLCRRAYDAIRATSRGTLESAYLDCARVLHPGLPSPIRRRLSMDTVVDAVRAMRREADRWVAVVEATMLFVGWTDANRARAADAIRLALEEYPPSADDD